MNVKNKAFLWVVLVFLAGSLFGGVATFLWVGPDTAAQVRPRPPWGDPEQHAKGTARNLDRLTQMLELDARQHEQLGRILDASHQQYREASDEARAQFRQLREESRQKIRTILNSEQLATFEAYLREREERFKKDRR